jgi:hypothetical protein
VNVTSFAKELPNSSSRGIDHDTRLAFEGLVNCVFGGLLLWTVIGLAGTALAWW